MMPLRRPRLATHLMLAQVAVVAIGAIAPVVTAAIVAPRLFRMHLQQAGVDDFHILAHAEQAFNSAIALAVFIGVVLSLAAATFISWSLVRRISAPIEQLADAAQDVAAGVYTTHVPGAEFTRELQSLADSFIGMSHRLDEIGTTRTRMLADLAHEVRTPLATLQAYVDGMEDGVIATDDTAWSTLRHEIQRLRRLADDIREVARAEDHRMEMERIDLREIAEAAVRSAGPRYSAKGVELVFAPRDGTCALEADPSRLQQVLANLLDNALRHTPAGGSVRLDLDCDPHWCRILISDTGEGIPEDQLDAVFERFHRVDPSRASSDGSGSGLGLTIARAIARAHGGALTATSAGPGQGTTFELRLPALPH